MALAEVAAAGGEPRWRFPEEEALMARAVRTERSLAAAGRFRARLLAGGRLQDDRRARPCPFPRVLHGRRLVREGPLVTAVAVPRPVPPPHREAPKEHL
ncbi:hypothetical protein ABTY59_11420 [Streptomyces sp. NPDC096079]|uniref:hypothetical protein n=1 Tax=unclassified Streptomyces TaxID=2593676 RepID=UPI003325B792